MLSRKEFIPIFIVLFVATLLRFLNFSELPYTHDEFSTIFRLDYENITDVIQIGMKELDNHPIGTQVFYYYYTKAFGTGEMIVKFPILIFGIFSVFMVYVLGRRWFNTTAGLFVASLFAVLQYAVVQSQVARMYGFGIPFILLMVYFWQFLLKNEFKWKHAIGFILSAVMCTYTHYFSMLFVAVVGVSGLFIVQKGNRLKYILSGFTIILIFLPSINIFLYQLAKGGIEGWLGTFKFTYLFTYLGIVFNRSWFVGAVVIVTPIYFFIRDIDKPLFRKLSIVWFLIPLSIGFLYSYFVSNVVHERVLYFSFPFLLLFLASYIKKQSLNKELVMVGVILLVGSLSLILERNHYKLFMKHRYKMVAESYMKWENEIADNKCIALKYTYDKVDDYYKSLYSNYQPSVNYADSVNSISELVQFLEKNDAEYLYFGQAGLSHTTELQIAKHYYPEIVKYEYTLAGEVYLLKKGKGVQDEHCFFNELDYNFKQNTSELKPEGNKYVITNDEYIGTIEAKTKNLIFSSNNIIEISADFMKPDSIGGAMLVSSIEENGELIDWRGIPLDDFIVSDSLYNRAFYSVPLPDIKFSNKALMKFVIWNPKKVMYEIKDFKVKVRAGNPYVYSSTEKIPWNLLKYCM